jgi:adenylate kinase family enzyme
VKPVIDYFDKKGLLVKINGEQPIENVHQEILSKIGK